MMSSFFENTAAAAAGTEIQESQALTPMQLANGGGAVDVASGIYAPPPMTVLPPPTASEAAPVITVSQPEGGVVANLANASVVVNEQTIAGDAMYASQPMPMVYQPEVVSAPMVYQPEVVVSAPTQMVYQPEVSVPAPAAVKVMNPTVAAPVVVMNPTVAAPVVVMNPPVFVLNDHNNNNNNTEVVVNANDQNNGNNSEVVNKALPVILNDQNNDDNNNNMVVNESVILNDQNNGNNNEVVDKVLHAVLNDQNNVNNNDMVVNESLIVKEENNGKNNEVVTPSVVVNNHNNGIANNGVVAMNSVSGEAMKRKRGRPRKYPLTDGSVLVSSPSMTMQSSGPAVAKGSSEKRGRGRPAGSAKKHKADAPSPLPAVSPAISGSAGVGFMPYVITVRSKENILPAILSLSQVDRQVVCVLTANGTISTVTLQQPSSCGGTVTYQGHFEILSLSGSFLLSESGGRRSTTGGLSVSLALPHDPIIGGGVAGLLIAESDVQIVVGTFMAPEQHLTRPGCNEVFITLPKHISSVGGSPPSHAPLSESSGGPGSPFNHGTGGCNNNNQQKVSNVAWM